MKQKDFKLTDENICEAVAYIKEYFASRKTSEKDVLRLGLAIEEALLRCRDKLGPEQEVTVETAEYFGAKVIIRTGIAGFNPLQEEYAGSILGSQYLKNLLGMEETTIIYRSRNGYDEIVAAAGKELKKGKIPGGMVTAAVLSAVVAALLTGLLPDKAASFLVYDLASPLFSRLMKMIAMVTGPLICVSVISGICALGDISTLSSIGMKAIRRFMVISVLMILFAAAISFLFFPGISASAGGTFNLSVIVKMLIELIPEDLVSPFVESKVIHIIVIAYALGVAALTLDEKIPNLRALISEAYQLVFAVMRLVAKIIPLTIFLSIYKAITQNSLANVLSVWKLVAANYAASIPFTAAFVLYFCLRYRVRIETVLKDYTAPAIIGFTTGSGTVAMSTQFETARDVLKIDEKVVGFWVPLSQAMFSPSTIAPLVTAAFFAAKYYGTPLSLPQILMMILMVTQLSVASPKVPGGIMAVFMILLEQLGMPADVVGLLMVANVFIINAQTGLGMLIRTVELDSFAREVGAKGEK